MIHDNDIIILSMTHLFMEQVRLQLQEKLDCDLTDRKKEVDELVMEVIDETTQDDDEEDESEEEESPPKKKKVQKKVARKRDASDSGSNYSAGGSDEDEAPSDGGGSDYEPDEPVKVGRAKIKKKTARRNSDSESSGEEWGGKKKGGKKGGRKRAGSSDEDDSDYEKPKKKKRAGGGGGKNGYTAPVKLSEELADIVGGDEMPRHEVRYQCYTLTQTESVLYFIYLFGLLGCQENVGLH